MKDFMIFHHDSEVVSKLASEVVSKLASEVVSKLASALPHLLCVQVSYCWERNEIK